MRPRLRKQNPAKYVDRSALDRDLMILQWALKNKVPLEETYDWRLPSAIEEYKHGIVDPRPPPSAVNWNEGLQMLLSYIPKLYFSPFGYSTLNCWYVYVAFLFSLRVFSFIPTSNDLITTADTLGLALILLFTRDCQFHPVLRSNNFTVEKFYSIYPVKSFVFNITCLTDTHNLHFLAARANLFCSHGWDKNSRKHEENTNCQFNETELAISVSFAVKDVFCLR